MDINNKINLTEFGLPEFFTFAQPKLNSSAKLKSQDKLSKKEIQILKNNNKKDKRIKNQSNNNNIKKINKIHIILETNNLNNISFSKSISDNNDDNIIEKEIEQENDKEQEEIIKDFIDENEIKNDDNNNNMEFKILKVDEITMEDNELDFEFEEIFEEENFDIHEEGENIEYEIINKKIWLIKRSSNKNKKEKINTDRYVSHSLQNKEGNRQHPIHKKQRKSSQPNYTSYYQQNNNSRGTTPTKYEQELNRALQLSQAEYEKQMNSNQMPLTQAQINDLLNRELTPEDFALLLLLDEQVKPKTISSHEVSNLPTITYTQQYYQFPACMICLCEFEDNEHLTKLPCNHIFHINCISNWLSNSSTKCPIDNISISHDH